MRTDELIARLTNELVAVRRLRPPYQRAAIWLALALPVVVLAVVVASPRGDLVAKLGEPRYLAEQGAALATATTAAVAAFALTVPSADRRQALLPALPGGIWLATLGLGCLADWLRFGAEGLWRAPEPACLGYIAGIGLVPALIIVAMLRRGVPLAPRTTLFLGGLAAAALASFGLRLFHDTDAGLMVLVWQFGSVLIFSLATGLIGPQILKWSHAGGRA